MSSMWAVSGRTLGLLQPTIAVVNTSSPTVSHGAPKARPAKTSPFSSTR